MIGQLKGIIDSMNGSALVIDVQGVGYVTTCSAHTLRQLSVGQPCTLKITTHVREDAISLFGFIDAEEQGWFTLLTTVQGVGAKVALSILSAVAPSRLAAVITTQDKTSLTEADGVGPKLALRIVTELKDKVANLHGLSAPPPSGGSSLGPPPLTTTDGVGVMRDALSALTNLGYRRAEVYGVLTTLHQNNPTAGLDEMIRAGLSELSRQAG